MARWDGRRWLGWAGYVVLALAMAVVLVGCGTDTYGGASPGAGPAPAEVGGRSRAARMPPALRASYVAARQRDGGEAYRFERGSSGGAYGRNEAHRVEVALEEGALRVTGAGGDGWHMGLRWTGIGRGSRVAPVARPDGEAYVVENRGSYRRADGSEEEYVNGPLGVGGGTAIVGAPYHLVGSNVHAGAAYVFVQSGTSWTQQAELTASDGMVGDLFGFSVSVSEGTAIVGAQQHGSGAGAAYVFVQSGTTWAQQAELSASDGAANDYFGYSVSVSGGTAIVGAPNHQTGAAYVFVQNGTTWAQQAELSASDGEASDYFGGSVSLSNGTAIVGANGYQVGSNVQAGAAYVFVQNGTTWAQQAELSASDGAANDYFGYSVSVSGGTAIVGAINHQIGSNPRAGAAYVFVQSDTTWTQQTELTASDGAMGDAFGLSVSLSGGTAIIGAPGHQVGSNPGAGAAYVFVQSDTTWTQQAEIIASDGAADDYFGRSVSLSGGTASVG